MKKHKFMQKSNFSAYIYPEGSKKYFSEHAFPFILSINIASTLKLSQLNTRKISVPPSDILNVLQNTLSAHLRVQKK